MYYHYMASCQYTLPTEESRCDECKVGSSRESIDVTREVPVDRNTQPQHHARYTYGTEGGAYNMNSIVWFLTIRLQTLCIAS